MSFGGDVNRWVDRTKARLRRVCEGSVHATHDSMVTGSGVTGAPGLGYRDGALGSTYHETVGPTSGRVTSVHPAAHVLEAGVRAGHAIAYPSGGGPHSNALTKAGFVPLVADVVREDRARG